VSAGRRALVQQRATETAAALVKSELATDSAIDAAAQPPATHARADQSGNGHRARPRSWFRMHVQPRRAGFRWPNPATEATAPAARSLSEQDPSYIVRSLYGHGGSFVVP